jgi:MFS family permease
MSFFSAKTLPYKGKKPFYGWVIVFVGFISQCIQGLVVQGFSSYTDLLSAEFGWSKAVIAGPRSVTAVQNSVLGPLAGWLMDKVGPRLVVAVGVITTGVGLIMLGWTRSLLVYYAANIVMALGLSLGGMMVMSVAVNNWFRRRATLAQSLMLMGYSLAGVLFVPLLVFLQSTMGWRDASIWSGIAVIAIGFPCSFLLRTKPETFGLLPDGDKPDDRSTTIVGRNLNLDNDFTIGQALRTRSFWMLGFAWAACMLATGVIQVHIFLQLEQDGGLERIAVGLIWSIASIINIPARLIGGLIGDRFPKNVMLAISIVLMGASVFALAMASSFGTALLFAIPYGIGWGISTPVINAIQGEYFGRRAGGVIRGWLQLVGLPFAIAGPVVVGAMADSEGTYRWAFFILATLILIGAIIAFLATRPRLHGTESGKQSR